MKCESEISLWLPESGLGWALELEEEGEEVVCEARSWGTCTVWIKKKKMEYKACIFKQRLELYRVAQVEKFRRISGAEGTESNEPYS